MVNMENLDKFISATRERYGVGLWTLAQVLGELPVEVFPASTQFIIHGRGAMTSLGHYLSGHPAVILAGKTSGGKKLYRLKA